MTTCTGFGDYTPVTAAGRVFFIPFALLAVPIVTSFAVQTITGLVRCSTLAIRDYLTLITDICLTQLSTFSNRGHTTEMLRNMGKFGTDFCRPHAELLDAHREAVRRSPTSSSTRKESPNPDNRARSNLSVTQEKDYSEHDVQSTQISATYDQPELIQRLMESVLKLEAQARRLLLDNLDHGLARTLLVADRNRTYLILYTIQHIEVAFIQQVC